MDGVERVSLKDRLKHGPSGDAKKILYIDVVRKTKPVSEEAFASDLAKTLLLSHRNLQGYDLVWRRGKDSAHHCAAAGGGHLLVRFNRLAGVDGHAHQCV